ncbi:ROK family protein [Paeniglutamicibacter kerguelensis]|uniref:Glucokinase n=1 Tax=Paeniglutamicibacter kerguelensis TaxID=254788 RepID=A0ABS4X8S6_9MICC|nr:glucokinase [Paeniglutamicibacter kerguelensis]
MYPRLGIDIGGTGISAVVLDVDGSVKGRACTDTPAEHGGDAMVAACRRVATLATERSGLVPRVAGVGAAGVIDADGVVLAASDSFTGWEGYPLGERLNASLSMPVSVGNDVAAFVLGEQRFGAGRGLENFFGIALGTGVGGGLVLNSDLHTGENGAAAEIGHIPGFGDRLCTCGRKGHLETIAAGRSIASLYALATGDSISTKDVARLAREGDDIAAGLFADAGAGLAKAALMISGILDVSALIIGGGVAHAWDLLQPAMDASLRRTPPISGNPVQVLRSELGTDAVAIGASQFADSLL